MQVQGKGKGKFHLKLIHKKYCPRELAQSSLKQREVPNHNCYLFITFKTTLKYNTQIFISFH